MQLNAEQKPEINYWQYAQLAIRKDSTKGTNSKPALNMQSPLQKLQLCVGYSYRTIKKKQKRNNKKGKLHNEEKSSCHLKKCNQQK